MVLSDRTIRAYIEAGKIIIEPYEPSFVQPSSVDLRLDRYFRVFRNNRHPYIDVRRNQDDLTELVEVPDGEPFMLHPGEFVLGSTLEWVQLPDDLVGRLEGKSSLGRLGLLIHSSLPADEPILVRENGQVRLAQIGDIVRRRARVEVVSFDPETFEVGYYPVTNWFEELPDRIYEVELASGRRVHVTAGHNLFTLDASGRLARIPTAELRPGMHVAIPRTIPPGGSKAVSCRTLELVPEEMRADLVLYGPSIEAAYARWEPAIARMLREAGKSVSFYRRKRSLPYTIATQLPGLLPALTEQDRVACRGARSAFPAVWELDTDLAWLYGLYAAVGCWRRRQVVFSTTDQATLDRVERILQRFKLPLWRTAGRITCCSALFAAIIRALGMAGRAHEKRLPPAVHGWPLPLQHALLQGLLDGSGWRGESRDSVWSVSPGVVSDVLYLAPQLGLRAAAQLSRRSDRGPRALPLYEIVLPRREHALLMSVPLPDRLLVELRLGLELSRVQASARMGYRYATDLANVERRSGRGAVHIPTLRRLHTHYAVLSATAGWSAQDALARLDRLVKGGLAWDEVRAVRDTGRFEPVYDLEVRPQGRPVENFLAGSGGVFVSNTAGFVDPGFRGHLTLELSNVATLPITLYPGMKIGQISFIMLTTPAQHPYGSATTGSKYQGQRGPTPSRYYLNFVSPPRNGADADG